MNPTALPPTPGASALAAAEGAASVDAPLPAESSPLEPHAAPTRIRLVATASRTAYRRRLDVNRWRWYTLIPFHCCDVGPPNGARARVTTGARPPEGRVIGEISPTTARSRKPSSVPRELRRLAFSRAP